MNIKVLAFLFTVYLLASSLRAFQSDELLVDDEEFGLEGAPQQNQKHSSDPSYTASSPTPTINSASSARRKFSDPDSDSKIQFTLEHAFGDLDFVPAGTFLARLKTWSHGGQTLTKLGFSRNDFTKEDKAEFEKLLRGDEFYRIRLPSNVVSAPGTYHVVSSIKARCLPKEGLDEHFVIYMEGVNIVAVNYGAPGACPYPRQMKLPTKWSFCSHTVLKSSEQAPRTPVFTKETLGEIGEGEMENPPERSFWAKYWMYLIPLGLVVMNAITQAMNMPEEQTTGQPAAVQRPSARRR